MARLGLALGGGGVAGSAHIGVIRALEDGGIPIDLVAGTSAGAFVAAFYASGTPGDELARSMPAITRRMLDYDVWGMIRRLAPPHRDLESLVKGERIRSFLETKLGHMKIQDAKLPLAITASDLCEAKQVIFSSVPFPCGSTWSGRIFHSDVRLTDAVMASISIPGLFPPVRLDDLVLVDGGLMDSCPTSALHHMGADLILAIDIIAAKPMRMPYNSVMAVTLRAMNIAFHRISRGTSSFADLILRPDVGAIGMLDFTRMEECQEQGYRCVRRNLERIRELLDQANGSGSPLEHRRLGQEEDAGVGRFIPSSPE